LSPASFSHSSWSKVHDTFFSKLQNFTLNNILTVVDTDAVSLPSIDDVVVPSVQRRGGGQLIDIAAEYEAEVDDTEK